MVNVRYMVDDVETAVAWYTTHLGFKLLSNQAPAFADVARGSLRLLLSGPSSSAGQAEVARLRFPSLLESARGELVHKRGLPS